jgi:hypothetical protein
MTLTFEMPNLGSARATYDSQARPSETDIAILSQGIAGTGMVTGCKVIPRSPTIMGVTVGVGNVLIYPTDYDIAETNLAIAAAHSTLHRRDLIVVDDSGFPSVIQGAVGQVNPLLGPLALPPALPDDTVGVGMVDVPPGATAITAAMILDKRAFVPPASFGSTAWTIIPKESIETRSNNGTLTDDSDLQFPMAANTDYSIRARIWASIASPASSNNGLKIGYDGPASPISVFGNLGVGYIAPLGTQPLGFQLITGTAYPNTGGFTYLRATPNISAPATATVIAEANLLIRNGSNAGTFRFTWSQVTASATQAIVTLYPTSYLEYIAI